MEHANYLKAVKEALRRRGIHYAELAQHLNLSESGVKKMLTGKDLSLRRLLQICEVMDILPGQLFALSENAMIPEVPLTGAQEEALIKDRQLLAIYWRFVVEKNSVEQIMRKQKITAPEWTKKMNKLVSLNLVALRQGKYSTLRNGKFRWSDQSILAKFLNQEWSELTLRRALKVDSAAQGMQRLSSLSLTTNSYEKILAQLQSLLDEAARTSEREELSQAPSKLTAVTLLVAAVKQGPLD